MLAAQRGVGFSVRVPAAWRTHVPSFFFRACRSSVEATDTERSLETRHEHEMRPSTTGARRTLELYRCFAHCLPNLASRKIVFSTSRLLEVRNLLDLKQRKKVFFIWTPGCLHLSFCA